MRSLRYFLLLVAAAAPLEAARFAATERMSRDLTLARGGTVAIENIAGNVIVVGDDAATGVTVVATKLVQGENSEAVAEGQDATAMMFVGLESHRIIRTIIKPGARRWAVAVNYEVRVPAAASVKVTVRSAELVRIANVRGSAAVLDHQNGRIEIIGVAGRVDVNTINGSIVFRPPARVGAPANLSTVNGNVHVEVDPQAALKWVAESIRRDYRTTLPLNGKFSGGSYVADVNGGGPIVRTTAAMGTVFLSAYGTNAATARPVGVSRTVQASLPAGSAPRILSQDLVNGNLQFGTNIGGVAIGRVTGSAVVTIGAGDIRLGAVGGECRVVSQGGPVNLGEIGGPLTASTKAGDVIVQHAKEGGRITTGGGTIRVMRNSGATTLQSHGGDIDVRRAGGAVNAETKSGDITINVDDASKSQRIEARTLDGNIVLTAKAGFAADVDATIITSNPESYTIRSDFPGLTFRREHSDGKTRIRATGKINGGGERVELYAVEGAIHLSSKAR